MSREAVETPSTCVLCGDTGRASMSCKLCHGVGVIPRDVAARWRSSQKAKATAATLTIAGLVKMVCERLEGLDDPRAALLAEEGRALLAVVDGWEQDPVSGPTRHEHFRMRCAPWNERANAHIRAVDAARKDPS